MNDFELREMYHQVQKLEEELNMIKKASSCCCNECNCDCCDKEE